MSSCGSSTKSTLTGDWFDLATADERNVVVIATHKGDALVALLAVGQPVVVGRDPVNEEGPTLRLNDTQVSRVHTRFHLTAGGLHVVEDLGSRNGTWVKGKRITRAELAIGEVVRVGATILKTHVFGGRVQLGGELAGDGEFIAGETMRSVLEKVNRLASTSLPVVLYGETGTGKEMVAELLHRRGHRREKPLRKVNCAAVPPNLVEATFFGHERGAFTGASGLRRGIFEEANGGTVLLDEIGDLPLAAQGALLRVLDKNSFSRVGSAAEISVDVRVVAATHRDLDALVRAGQFRADLYHRLSGVVLELPPLRERRDDVPPLAQRFLRAATEANGSVVREFDPETLRVLEAYPWPGNVRELKHAIERAVVLTTYDRLLPDDFPRQHFAFVAKHGSDAHQIDPTDLRAAPLPRVDKVEETPGSRRDVPPGNDRKEDLPNRLRTLEATMIRDALQAVNWNRASAAERLGIPLRTLARKISALGIEKPHST